MNTSNILILSPSNIATDPRVLRHIKVAKEFGTVTTCGYGVSPDEATKHFEITSTARFLARSAISLISIQFGMHRFAARRTQFYKEASNLLRHKSFDLVIANDVHSIQTAIDLFPPEVIWVDMHEYAPLESEHDWRWRVAYRRHIKHQCTEHLRKVAAVSSVGKKICQRYEEDLNRPVALIRNAASYEPKKNKNHDFDSSIRCVHVGAAIRARKLEDLVTAVGKSEKNLTLDLFLIPTDVKYLRDLEQIADLYPNVQINQPVIQEELIDVISSFDVGCVAIPPTSYNYANCLPNKFFQYIQARIPIMSGPIPEIAEIVRSMNIGWIAEGFNVDDSQTCLDSLTYKMIEETRDFLDTAAKELSSETDNEVRRSIIQEIRLG